LLVSTFSMRLDKRIGETLGLQRLAGGLVPFCRAIANLKFT